MSRSQHYDAAMVGVIIARQQSSEKIQYVPASPASATPGSVGAPVKMTLPKLDAATYNVFAFFWSDPAEDKHISAGLTPDQMMEFRPRSCQSAEASQFAQPVKVAEGNRLLYRAFLGRVKTDPGQPSGQFIVLDSADAPVLAGFGYQKAD
jgi:hypothetical protein